MKSCRIVLVFLLFAVILLTTGRASAQSVEQYKIVGTGQTKCYDTTSVIAAPAKGSPFYGQDAQFSGNQPSYTDNGDGTVTDNITGLMWAKSLDLNHDGRIDTTDRLTYDEAIAYADTMTLGGYHDWRVPTIKELYSLINFSGAATGTTDSTGGIPFIDRSYFTFVYGDTSEGERVIDVQCISSTKYVSTTMNGNPTAFGVNFADGRIKGYPIMNDKKHYVRFVRGNTGYGINRFRDNGDGTVTDSATGLMWTKEDSRKGMNWEGALAWAQSRDSADYLGYDDWRLPNVKELQSIVDYSRSPATTSSAAIDTVFDCSSIIDEGGNVDYPFFWSSTTHLDYYANAYHASEADYVAFGKALGYMSSPAGGYQLMDVHGAGAQRTDPKAGNPADYPHGRGPQGDVIRIYNYVRLVRNASVTDVNQDRNSVPDGYVLEQNYPNPFNPTTMIRFSLKGNERVTLSIYNVLGQRVEYWNAGVMGSGTYNHVVDMSGCASGVYFYSLRAGSQIMTRKMLLMK